MMMHQNRIFFYAYFERLRPRQLARRFHPSIEDIKGCRGSHWTTLSDKNWPRKAPTTTMVIQFLRQKCAKIRKKCQYPQTTLSKPAGILIKSKPCAKVRSPYESEEAELSIAVLDHYWDQFLEILHHITWALDRKWAGVPAQASPPPFIFFGIWPISQHRRPTSADCATMAT